MTVLTTDPGTPESPAPSAGEGDTAAQGEDHPLGVDPSVDPRLDDIEEGQIPMEYIGKFFKEFNEDKWSRIVDGDRVKIAGLTEQELKYAVRTHTNIGLSGVGYESYSPAEEGTADKWAQPEVASFLTNFARHWHRLHPDDSLQIGDISRYHGGSDTEHTTHKFGMDVDIRVAQMNAALVKELAVALFNFDNRTFLQKVTGQQQNVAVARIIYNNPVLVKEMRKLEYNMITLAGHDTHFHVDFIIRDPETGVWTSLDINVSPTGFMPYNERK